MKSGAVYLASILSAAAIGLASPAASQQTDWTKRITMSAKGGHVMGNPLAKNRVTEYMSYTCNHCANFETQSHAPLKNNFIKKGHVKFEVRNLVLNSVDLTAAVLARCGGRTKFFGNHRALLIQQPTWLQKFQSTPASVKKTLNEGTISQRLVKIAKAAGFYGLMKKRGYSAAQINSCLSDQTARTKILGMTEYATKTLKLGGTPSFTINGKVQKQVHSWPALRPKLTGLAR